jgi:hypothetical protein
VTDIDVVGAPDAGIWLLRADTTTGQAWLDENVERPWPGAPHAGEGGERLLDILYAAQLDGLTLSLLGDEIRLERND